MKIKLTDAAVKEVLRLMKEQNFDPTIFFLRMGVKGGGCSGLSYLLEFDNDLSPHDLTFEKETKDDGSEVVWGFRVVTDKKSILHLNGITLDFATAGLVSGFKFHNPNTKHSCGCGTSFSA